MHNNSGFEDDRKPGRLAQLLRQNFGAEMGVALEHAQRFMTRDAGDFHRVETFLE